MNRAQEFLAELFEDFILLSSEATSFEAEAAYLKAAAKVNSKILELDDLDE